MPEADRHREWPAGLSLVGRRTLGAPDRATPGRLGRLTRDAAASKRRVSVLAQLDLTDAFAVNHTPRQRQSALCRSIQLGARTLVVPCDASGLSGGRGETLRSSPPTRCIARPSPGRPVSGAWKRVPACARGARPGRAGARRVGRPLPRRRCCSGRHRRDRAGWPHCGLAPARRARSSRLRRGVVPARTARLAGTGAVHRARRSAPSRDHCFGRAASCSTHVLPLDRRVSPRRARIPSPRRPRRRFSPRPLIPSGEGRRRISRRAPQPRRAADRVCRSGSCTDQRLWKVGSECCPDPR